ncbi:glycoside hydrolase family 97 protein [Asticcacaulis solisilvae]|uniref:glycoside hydrolase family 97 protein n=1 Tax=Asticcacaulis solisilvae TaxID=1217274 RepID=UPI003FD8ADFB
MRFKSAMRTLSFSTALLTACLVSPALADDLVAQGSSPDGTLSVKLYTDATGKISYEVDRKGAVIIAPSRMGFLVANAPALDGQFALDSQKTSSADETWEQPWGERRYVRNHYNELRVDFVQKVYDNRHMTVVFRLFDDGIGFRYEFPDQPQLKDVKIIDEQTEFAVADPAKAWWNVGGEWDNLEYLYNETPLNEVSQANTPLTIKTDKGVYIALHEAALTDFASMWVRRVDGQRLKAHLAPGSLGPSVERQAPFTSPWRTMIITDNAPALYNSNIELNLNEPNKLGDVSWVKPYKYVGIWWEMHLEKSTWAQGPKHGATTDNTKKYIDFAAKNGFRGVLVEGWNPGWDGQWFGSGKDFDYTRPTPDFDLKALAAYGAAKGVHLVGHHETGGNMARYESQMDQAYQLYAANGVDSVKTGYVTDAGTDQFAGPGNSIHYGFSDSQEGSRHYTKVLELAAKYHIAVDSHEPIKDTGLRRTYPNWVSREGARGQEYNAWGTPINPPEHEANLVFTRMLAGPFDFTPGVLSLEGNKRDLLSTQAKQLALYVVLYSPIQMAADLPENYAKYPQAFQFIKDVPTDWSESSMLSGEPGDYAVIARKDRTSQTWYLGGISDDQWRTASVPLSFLTPGKTYTAEIYRDGDHADDKGPARFDIVIEKKTVTAKDVLMLKMAPGGGFAIRLVPGK